MIIREPLFSIPVRCDWPECPKIWHEYMVYVAGTDYIFEDLDNSRPQNIAGPMMRVLKALAPGAWQSYGRYVAERGVDRLARFYLRREMNESGLRDAAREALAAGWQGQKLGGRAGVE